MPDAVTVTTLDDAVTLITLDDGKVNALSHDVVAAVRAGVAEAATGGRAVAIVGRPGRFSAGFDLTTMRAGPEAARDLLEAGAELAIDLFTAPVPVVVGCTGHALAMGAILLFAVDARIGAAGPHKIGLNEVAIGMPVPRFAIALARYRLTPSQVEASLQQATIHDPEAARAAGFLDEVVDGAAVVDRAVERARELGTGLDGPAFRATRRALRADTAERLTAALAADVAEMGSPPG
jgi:enoyl-CoA hydratase